MKLDRNITNPRKGKYALLRLREWPHGHTPECQAAFETLKEAGAIDFGDTDATDFFLIRLKDKYASTALYAYSEAAREDDPEYADEILQLANYAEIHPLKKRPD